MKPEVRVWWHDAQDAGDTWVSESDAEQWAEKTCQIRSLGWLVSKTEKYLTLAGDWDEVDKNYGRLTKIPTGMVQRIEEISSGKESKD